MTVRIVLLKRGPGWQQDLTLREHPPMRSDSLDGVGELVAADPAAAGGVLEAEVLP